MIKYTELPPQAAMITVVSTPTAQGMLPFEATTSAMPYASGLSSHRVYQGTHRDNRSVQNKWTGMFCCCHPRDQLLYSSALGGDCFSGCTIPDCGGCDCAL
jgi:hypothetical protein